MKNSKKNKAFVKPSGAKQSKFFIHVAAVKNTRSVTEESELPDEDRSERTVFDQFL